MSLPRPVSLETNQGGVAVAGREALGQTLQADPLHVQLTANCAHGGRNTHTGKDECGKAVPDSATPRNAPLGLPALLLPDGVRSWTHQGPRSQRSLGGTVRGGPHTAACGDISLWGLGLRWLLQHLKTLPRFEKFSYLCVQWETGSTSLLRSPEGQTFTFPASFEASM